MDKPGTTKWCLSMRYYAQKPKRLLPKYATCWNLAGRLLHIMPSIANLAR